MTLHRQTDLVPAGAARIAAATAPERFAEPAGRVAKGRMRRLHQFLWDDQGAMTIEFVLWVPFIVALLTIVIDATTLYVTHTEMWNVARDTTRRMVEGSILTVSGAEAYAASAMSAPDYPYSIQASYDVNKGAQVTISLTVSDMSIISYLSPLTIFGRTIVARVVMRVDPSIPFQTTG